MTKLPPGGQNSQKMLPLEIKSPSLWPGSLRGVRIFKKCSLWKLQPLSCDQAPCGVFLFLRHGLFRRGLARICFSAQTGTDWHGASLENETNTSTIGQRTFRKSMLGETQQSNTCQPIDQYFSKGFRFPKLTETNAPKGFSKGFCFPKLFSMGHNACK